MNISSLESIHTIFPEEGIVQIVIEKNKPGRVRYHATEWFGRCIHAITIPVGTAVRVTKRVGNTLIVEPLGIQN